MCRRAFGSRGGPCTDAGFSASCVGLDGNGVSDGVDGDALDLLERLERFLLFFFTDSAFALYLLAKV
jgi:hypothetical protein